jgi:hypothetical protein
VNHLLIGTDDHTQRLLNISKPRFLLIDDGPIADAFLTQFPKARPFDPAVHSFDPLAGMDYPRARAFADALYAASPQGENTLTVRNGKRALAKLALATTARLDNITGDTKDPAIAEALATIDDALLSPVLRRVLCGNPNFRFGEGTTVAKLDRSAIGDFDAFVLATLLIARHKAQIIIPDFGFYGRPFHVPLMRQNRLTAGVRVLAELEPKLRQAVLTIKDKSAHNTTADDAETLAQYNGLIPGTTAHTDFVQRAIGI